MPFVKWDEQLSVAIASIDREHQHLFQLINDYYDSGRNKAAGPERMQKLLTGLQEYTVVHFRTEETAMKRHGFPGLAGHQREHQHFVDWINQVAKRYASGELVLPLEVSGYISDWILQHIRTTDQLYSRFLVEKGMK